MPDKKSLLDSLPVLDSTDNKTSGANSLLDNLPTIDDNKSTIPTKRSAQTAANGIDAQVATDNLSYATDVMKRLTGFDAAEEPAKPNIVQFKGETPNGTQTTRTYAAIPDKGIAIEQKTTPGLNTQAAEKLTYQPQVGEAFRNAVTHEEVQKAQTEVANEINANAEYLQKDATALLAAAPPIIQDQLKSLGITSDFPKRLINTQGDLDALKLFSKAKNAQLQNDKQNDLADLEMQYPMQGTTSRNEFAQPAVRENEAQYNQQKAAIDKKYADQEAALNNAAFNLASIKAFNQELTKGIDPSIVSPQTIGKNIQNAMGEDVQSESPDQKVQTELLGYHALDVMAKKAFADGDLELFKTLQDRTKDATQKVIDNNPEFRKQQVQKALSDEIFKEGNSLWETAVGKNVTQEDVDAAAQKLGLRPQDYQDIDPNDLKRWSGVLNTGVNSFLRESVAPIIEGADRHLLNPIMNLLGNGLNDEQLNSTYDNTWYDKSAVGRFFGGNAPDNAGIVNSGTKVEINPLSQNYLLNVSDENNSQWNLGLVPFLNTVANGVGQSTAVLAGGEVTGGLLKGAQIVNDLEKSRRIGMNAFMALTGWDRSYKNATQSIGTNPEDEGKRIALAMIYNGAEVASENIIPEYKLFDKIRGTRAVGDLLTRIENEGVNAIGKEAIQKAWKEGALEAGKNILGEGAEEVATTYGDMVGDMVFAPDKYNATNYNQQALQDGVTGAVSAFLPVGAGSVREIAEHGPMAKSMLYEVGNNSQYYADQFQQQIDNGNLSQEEGNHKISMVHTMADIVKNSVPEVSVANNQDLTPKQQHDYANLRLQEEILKSRREKVKDPVQEQYIDKQLANIDVQKYGILQTAGPATQDNSSSINTSNNGKNNEAQEAGRQEGQNVLESQQTNKQSSGAEQSASTAIAISAPIDDLLGQLEDETTTTNTPQNTVTDATQVNQQPQQEGNQQSSVGERSGTQAGQPEIGQSEGQQRNAAQPEANSGNSDQRSQEEQKVASFETSKGSVYTVLPDGRTQRFKTATNETNEPQDLTAFVKFKDVQQEQDFLDGIQRRDGTGTKVYLVDQSGNIYNNNEEAKGKDVKLALVDTKTGNTISLAETSLTPKVGYNTFDQRRFNEDGVDKRESHIGNPVTKINYAAPKNTTTSTENEVVENMRPTAVDDGKKVDYTTDNGNQRVVYQNGGLKVLNAKGEEVSAPTKRKAISEAADKYDFTTGEVAPPVPEDVTTDEEYGKHITTTSNSPVELVNLYQTQEPIPQALSSIEQAISEQGAFTTTNKSFDRFGDRNNKGRGIGLNYLNNTKGTPIDEIAREISDNTGLDVQPQDIVDFMQRFPQGVQQAQRTQPTQTAIDAQARFEQLTGFPLTKDIAEKVMAQFEAKQSEAYRNALEKDYENEQELTAELDRLIAAGEIKIQESAPNNVSEANSGNESPDQQNEPGSQQPGQEPVTSPTAEALSPEEDKMRTMLNTIEDLKSKIEKSDAAREKLRKEGKENTDAYKVKVAAYQQLKVKLRDAEKTYRLESAKIYADKIRSKKVQSANLLLTSPLQIPIGIYNAALETAALAIEGGAHIRNAVQSAVDYVNERVHTKWDEQKFRKNVLNEDAAFPFTPEELRQQKLNETELSDKNRQIADALVDKVKNNEATLDEVLDKINTTSLSPAVKEKISQYLRKNTTENVFKLDGKDMADKYLTDYNNDFNAAREEMGKAYDTTLLSAQNETEKDNARKTFVAATAYLNAKETEQKVKDGDIKPTSILPENNVPKNLFALPKLTKIREAEYKFANRFARIRDAQKAAQDITKETDALSAYRLAKPRAWDKVNEIRQWLGSSDTVKGSLFDRMKKADVDLHKFNLFLYAQHAEERNAQNAKSRQSAFESKVYDLQTKIADAKSDTSRLNYQSQLDDILQQRNPAFVLMPDGGSGMTNQEAQEILQEVDNDGNTEKYQKFADEFREHVVQPILDFKYDSGLIDEEQYNRIRSAYQNYVPLKFDIEEAKRLADGTDGRTPEERAEDTKLQTERKKGKDLYKSSGAAEIKWGNRNSPVLQALSDLEHSILQGENNLANIRMANLVRENPNEDIWDVKPARYNITTDKDGNVTYTEEINPPKDAVPFWEDGKKSYLVFNDKGLKAAFEKAPDPNALLRLGSALSTLYRTGATLRNPDFIVKNVLIDQQDASAAVSAEQNKELTKNLKKNRGILGANLFKEAVPQLIKDEGPWADARREWSKNGGKVSFTKPLSLQEEAQQANKIYEAYGSNVSPHQVKKYIKSPLTALENFSEFLEEITRIMVYKSARESGIDEEKSALLSRDATIDFEKSGTKGAYLNAFKVFMNAALQGTINDATRFKKSDAFRKWAGGMALAGAGMGVLNSLLSDCDPPDNPDCYDELPEYKKQRSFIVPMKAFGGKGFLTIPMGRQLGIFGYIGQLAQSTSEYYASDGEHGLSPAEAFKNLTEATANAYIPGGGQPIMQSLAGNFGFLVGLKTNENSFGSRIHPDNFKNVPEHDNAFRNTPEFWKGLSSEISKLGGGGPGKNAASEAFEISPNTLQYIAQSLLTGYYSTGAKIANTTKAITNDEPLKSKDIPVVGSFVARESNMSLTKDRKANLVDKSKKQILTDKEMNQLKGYLKDLKEGGQDPTGKATSGTMRFVMKSQQQVKKHEKEGAKSEE